MPFFRRSAVRVGVQPPAELRHLQRHNHGRHVLRALLPVPCPCNLQSRPLLHATCPAVARHRPPSGTLHLAPHCIPSPFDSRQKAIAFNQLLSFDTSSVKNMNNMINVRSSPYTLLPICSRVLPCMHAACPAVARAASCLPTSTSPRTPHALLSTLGSPRRRSTSR